MNCTGLFKLAFGMPQQGGVKMVECKETSLSLPLLTKTRVVQGI
jgi:hypothetical protein